MRILFVVLLFVSCLVPISCTMTRGANGEVSITIDAIQAQAIATVALEALAKAKEEGLVGEEDSQTALDKFIELAIQRINDELSLDADSLLSDYKSKCLTPAPSS